jgi:hypothetical protein
MKRWNQKRDGLMLYGLAGIVAMLLTPTLTFGVTPGQTDTFQDGTTDFWTDGNLGDNVAVIADGGPAGISDAFLQVSSGAFGGSERLITFNDTQWIGDFAAAGVTAVEMDLKNFGSNDLPVRIAIRSAAGNSATPGYSSTTPFSLSADGAWHHAVFLLNDSSMTPINVPPPFAAMVTNVMDFRLLCSANPATMGDRMDAQIGVDNIKAIAPVQILSPQLSNGIFSFAFTSTSNASYTVYANTNLATATWVVRTNLLGNGSNQLMRVLINNSVPQQFFRVSQP